MIGERSRAKLVPLLALLALLALLGFVTTGCGGTTRTHPPTNHGAASAACHAGGVPDECLRFIEHVVRVRSMVLTARVAKQVGASCAGAGRETRLEVICPPLVPVGGVVNNPELYGPQIVDGRSYSVSINNGQNPGHIHWEFGAIAGPATRLWVFDRANWDARPPKHPARVIGHRRYLGYLITLYRFPDNDGQLEGHDAAFVTQNAISYFVSIHGHRDDDADIAMLLAILLRST